MASFRLAPTAQLVNFLLAEVCGALQPQQPLLSCRAGKGLCGKSGC